MSFPNQFRILFQTDGILEAESASSLNLFCEVHCNVLPSAKCQHVQQGARREKFDDDDDDDDDACS